VTEKKNGYLEINNATVMGEISKELSKKTH
jgi:hypothetical protein